MSSTASYYYVYGIVDAEFGIDEPPLRAAIAGPVAAVYERLHPDELGSLDGAPSDDDVAQLALKHDAVVHALARRGAVLPMRLGTVWPDLDGIITVLRRASGALRDALDQVRGCAEWELRVERTERRAAQDGIDAATGTQYLLDRRAERLRVAVARRPVTAELDASDGALVAKARAVVSRELPAGGVARAYLVPAERSDDFVDEADRVAAALTGVDYEATLRGPLAAYSFVDLRLEAR